MRHSPLFIAQIILSLAFASALAGCQTFNTAGLIQSAATSQITPAAASSIASDMVGQLADHIGPGSVTIQLKLDGSTFGQALEAALREKGYAVVTDQAADKANTALAYVVDDFDGSTLVRLSTPTMDITRIYRPEAGGAAPASPFSLMLRRQGKPT